MRTRKHWYQVAFTAILALSFLYTTAGEKPQMSGKWKLIQGESKLNAEFSLAPQTMEIEQTKEEIHIVRHVNMQGQEIAIDEKMTLDGKECENPGFQGSKKLCIATWTEANALSIDTKMESDFGSMNTTQVYSLEGNKLKVVSTFASPNGDVNETWVLEKE